MVYFSARSAASWSLVLRVAGLILVGAFGHADTAAAQASAVAVRVTVPEVLVFHAGEETPVDGLAQSDEGRSRQTIRVSANAPWELLVRQDGGEAEASQVWWRVHASRPAAAGSDFRLARSEPATVTVGEAGHGIPLTVEYRWRKSSPRLSHGASSVLRYTLVAR